MVSDIHQTPLYSQFMQTIGWKIEKVDTVNAFIKPFPFFGSIIKIQRPPQIPSLQNLEKLKRKHHAFSISIEPSLSCDIRHTKYDIQNNSYLPTKTIRIDLKQSEDSLFKHFSESTRRAIRRAMKNNVVIEESPDIDAFIKLKGKSFGFLGFLFTRDIKPLWNTCHPRNATLLLAHSSQQSFAGILLLFSGKTAYYWLAVSSKIGNNVAAPSLLVWEALRLARKKGCTMFDFEGIWDERFPKQNRQWLGFTRFKKGFGGTEIYFPQGMQYH